MNGIALAYSGVHQIFQLALAAHELGELDGLFCSIVDGDGKWGSRFRNQAPAGTVRPLGWAGLPQAKLLEYPWPILLNRVLKKYLPWRSTEHRWSNAWFDRASARWLRQRPARVFVGAETCAMASLRQAGQMGMKRVLDCPGVPAQALEEETRRAAFAFGLTASFEAKGMALTQRKQRELAEGGEQCHAHGEHERRRAHGGHPGLE